MTEVLGYPRFGAYGGDIGAHATGFLGANYPDRVVGIYTHHPSLHPAPLGGPLLSAAEHAYLTQRESQHSTDGAFQSTRPDTLAAALTDS